MLGGGALALTGAPIHDGRDEDSPDCPPLEEILLSVAGGFPKGAPELAPLLARMGAVTGLLKEEVRRWLLPCWGAAAVEEVSGALELGEAEVDETREVRAVGGDSSKSPARATSMLSSSCLTVLQEHDWT